MCLAIPGKILEVYKNSEPRMGKVSFGGIQKTVCLDWVPDAAIGDYVIVHVGFALNTIDTEEAEETLKLLDEMEGALDEVQAPEVK
jgi:hydrogenase expression/formation protein HypC